MAFIIVHISQGNSPKIFRSQIDGAWRQGFDGTWRQKFDGKGRSRIPGDIVPEIRLRPFPSIIWRHVRRCTLFLGSRLPGLHAVRGSFLVNSVDRLRVRIADQLFNRKDFHVLPHCSILSPVGHPPTRVALGSLLAVPGGSLKGSQKPSFFHWFSNVFKISLGDLENDGFPLVLQGF